MTGTGGTALAATAGALAGLGMTLIVLGLRGHIDDGTPRRPWHHRWTARLRRHLSMTTGRRTTAVLVVAIGTGTVTRWPVAAVLAGLAVWTLPRLWYGDRATAEGTAKLEAIAVWTEMLRDTLAAAAGLEQALLATAASVPEPLTGPVSILAARIQRGEPLPQSLHAFADDVDDPTADLVVAALVLAATRQARQLGELLSTLAVAARDQVVLRLRVAAGRARIRTSVRIILVVTVAMMTGLVVLNRGYLDGYDSVLGQLMLLLVGALFAAAFAWLNQVAAITAPVRILAPGEPVGQGAPR